MSYFQNPWQQPGVPQGKRRKERRLNSIHPVVIATEQARPQTAGGPEDKDPTGAKKTGGANMGGICIPLTTLI
jgi:hypothetical protein